MPIKRYKPEQIVTMLRQVEVSIANGKTTPQACKEAEITVQTFYRWRTITILRFQRDKNYNNLHSDTEYQKIMDEVRDHLEQYRKAVAAE